MAMSGDHTGRVGRRKIDRVRSGKNLLGVAYVKCLTSVLHLHPTLREPARVSCALLISSSGSGHSLPLHLDRQGTARIPTGLGHVICRQRPETAECVDTEV